MANYGSHRSQYLIWPFFNPYFCKLHFTIYTIYSTDPSITLCDDKLVFSHTTLGTPHKIWTLLVENFGEHTQPALNFLSKNA